MAAGDPRQSWHEIALQCHRPVHFTGLTPPPPAPFTFGAFIDAFREACQEAWDDGRRQPVITLPVGVFPDVEKMVNPITRDLIAVRRVPMFSQEVDDGGR